MLPINGLFVEVQTQGSLTPKPHHFGGWYPPCLWSPGRAPAASLRTASQTHPHCPNLFPLVHPGTDSATRRGQALNSGWGQDWLLTPERCQLQARPGQLTSLGNWPTSRPTSTLFLVETPRWVSSLPDWVPNTWAGRRES